MSSTRRSFPFRGFPRSILVAGVSHATEKCKCVLNPKYVEQIAMSVGETYQKDVIFPMNVEDEARKMQREGKLPLECVENLEVLAAYAAAVCHMFTELYNAWRTGTLKYDVESPPTVPKVTWQTPFVEDAKSGQKQLF